MATFADLLFRTVDGVFAVDAKQRIIFWNPACAQLLGVSGEQALGRTCSEVIQGTDPLGQPFCGAGCCVARLARRDSGPKTFPLKVRDGNGQELRLSVSIVLVPRRGEDDWTCVHLLHCGEAPDMLDALEYAARQARPTNGGKADGRCPLSTAVSPLTAREGEILRLLAEGLSVRLISQLLSIGAVTVRNHIQHIEVKLGVHSQVEAVAYAYRHNMV